jgi:hypothetical protein
MAKIKSKWWKPSPLQYTATFAERKRKEAQYRWWLASERGWSVHQVDLYLQRQREWVQQWSTASTAKSVESPGGGTLAFSFMHSGR